MQFPCVALAGNVLAPDKPLKGLLRQYAAHLLLALAGATGLLHLRGVYAVEPDLGFAYVDGVAINDTGLLASETVIPSGGLLPPTPEAHPPTSAASMMRFMATIFRLSIFRLKKVRQASLYRSLK